jgi:hypothetical protein
MRKLLVLAAIGVLAFAPGVEAKQKTRLDPGEQIIYQKLCAAHASGRYSAGEVVDYAFYLIDKNTAPVKIPRVSSSEMYSDLKNSVVDLMEDTRQKSISATAKKLLNLVVNNCSN